VTLNGQRFLVVYSGVLTAAFAFVVLTGAASIRKGKASFDEITVQRINVVEPDGTLRMVVSNHARLPGVYHRGKESPPEERPQAGMIFLNDEGTEVGGLIFGGRKNEKGEVVDSGGSLSFDRYEGNQVIQLLGVDDKTDRIAGLIVGDNPWDSKEVHRRILVGRGESGTATVALSDGQGRKRLVMQVTADGKPSLSFLDAEGKVVREVLATGPAR
jgi:hypothetical protein